MIKQEFIDSKIAYDFKTERDIELFQEEFNKKCNKDLDCILKFARGRASNGKSYAVRYDIIYNDWLWNDNDLPEEYYSSSQIEVELI